MIKSKYKFTLDKPYNHLFLSSRLVRLKLKSHESKYYTLNRYMARGEKGYSWDGNTMFFDFKSTRVASMVHDIMYQAMREGVVPRSYRREIDKEFFLCCVHDGTHPLLACVMWLAVRVFGGFFI